MKYSEIKQELKTLAKTIRLKKATRKQHVNGVVPGLYEDQFDYRHKHIAYCMLRNTPYEAVECPRIDNRACRASVERFARAYDEIRATQLNFSVIDGVNSADEAA